MIGGSIFSRCRVQMVIPVSTQTIAGVWVLGGLHVQSCGAPHRTMSKTYTGRKTMAIPISRTQKVTPIPTDLGLWHQYRIHAMQEVLRRLDPMMCKLEDVENRATEIADVMTKGGK